MQRRKMQNRENATDSSAQCAHRTASFPPDPTSLDLDIPSNLCIVISFNIFLSLLIRLQGKYFVSFKL